MKLYAISDLHLGYRENRAVLETLESHSEDWLILGGDVGESLEHLELALEVTTERFARVLWVPGNHELWSYRSGEPRGQQKYEALVARCREFDVVTPEDPYVVWEGESGPVALAPLFLLYDYSFRPDHVSREEAVDWARQSGVVSADERYLHPDPHETRDDWCAARCEEAERRLEEAASQYELILINHFPLRRELVRLRRIPRFSLWCGTRRTEDWHRRFRARVVVSGHLHIRATDWIDGVRFEEVSLGYPRHWNGDGGIEPYLREILPGNDQPHPERARRMERRGPGARPWG